MSDEAFRLFNAGVSAALTAQKYRQQGNHAEACRFEEQAVMAFDQVLAIQPTHAGAVGGKGMCLAQLGRTKEAAELFQRASAAEPRNPEYHRQLGLCYAELGDIDGARTATRRALELDGRVEHRQQAAIEIYNVGAHVMTLGAGHRDEGRPAEEQQCYRQAMGLFSLVLEIEPNNDDAVEALEVVELCLAGRPPSAKPWWRFW